MSTHRTGSKKSAYPGGPLFTAITHEKNVITTFGSEFPCPTQIFFFNGGSFQGISCQKLFLQDFFGALKPLPGPSEP